jgi:hypothetical protein
MEGALKRASDQTGSWNLSMDSLMTKTGLFVAGSLAGVAAGIWGFVNALIPLGSELSDLEAKTGVSTTALQGLKYAAEQTGTPFATVTTAIGAMGEKLASGDKSAIAALNRLGLSFADIRAMKPEDAFLTITDAIGKVPDPMQQAADAGDLFGSRLGRNLLPTINDASGGFRALASEAEGLGIVINRDTILALDALARVLRCEDRLGTVQRLSRLDRSGRTGSSLPRGAHPEDIRHGPGCR